MKNCVAATPAQAAAQLQALRQELARLKRGGGGGGGGGAARAKVSTPARLTLGAGSLGAAMLAIGPGALAGAAGGDNDPPAAGDAELSRAGPSLIGPGRGFGSMRGAAGFNSATAPISPAHRRSSV